MGAPPDITQQRLWPGGMDSFTDPFERNPRTFEASYNCLALAGLVQTRPGFQDLTYVQGFAQNFNPSVADQGRVQGIGSFSPDGIPTLVWVQDGRVFIAQFPYKFFEYLPLSAEPAHRPLNRTGPVYIERCVESVRTNPDGSLTLLDAPKELVVIQDGAHRPVILDGHSASTSNPGAPDYGVPVGTIMRFLGDRLWLVQGNRLLPSNLGEPTKFTEINIIAGGGALAYPSPLTGLSILSGSGNRSLLLPHTGDDTYSVKALIRDRTKWGSTDEFSALFIPKVGCSAWRSCVNQFGLSWWWSPGGLVSLDDALSSQRTSRVLYHDLPMARSKFNLSKDLSGIACGSWEQFLLVSVPSGDPKNAHTWVLNAEGESQAWSGIWNGWRAVQWVNVQQRGSTRIFCANGGPPTYPGDTEIELNFGPILEAFIPARTDNGGPIPCLWESNLIRPQGATRHRLEFIEIDFAEISGRVNVIVEVAGALSGYYVLAQVKLNAQQGPILNPDLEGDPDTPSIITDDQEDNEEVTDETVTLFFGLRPQNRTARLNNIANSPAGRSCSAENTTTAHIDEAFSIRCTWEGQCGIRAVRIFTTKEKETGTGGCARDESEKLYGVRTSGHSYDVTPLDPTLDHEPPALIYTGESLAGPSRIGVQPNTTRALYEPPHAIGSSLVLQPAIVVTPDSGGAAAAVPGGPVAVPGGGYGAPIVRP